MNPSSSFRQKVTLREKELIIGHYMENNSISATAKIVRRSISVVWRVVNRYNQEGSLEEKQKSGRPRKTTSREDRDLVRMSLKDRFETAASISRKFKENTGKIISRDTVSRRLNEKGLKSRTAVAKPVISKKNQRLRLAYATSHVTWNEEEWNRIFFSDESKFNVFGSDGRNRVRRRQGERLSPKCVKKTVKFGGGSVMVWGIMSASGVGPLVRLHGRVNAEVYRHLLQQNAISYLSTMRQDALFMQDNAPCHKAKKVMDFLKEQNIETLNWPPQSPDLNPIKNLWKLIGERAQNSNPRNSEELWSLLKREWYNISSSFCRSLINSCSRRCQAVIDSKGMFTKY